MPATPKPKKPLPLFAHEERKVAPQGKPVDPREILSDRMTEAGYRAKVWLILWGAKSIGLINNYRRMKKYGLFAFLGLLYLLLVIAWAPCFGLAFIVIYGLYQSGVANFPVPVAVLLVLVILPIYPYILAWVQQEQYDQWLREYDEGRRKYFEKA